MERTWLTFHCWLYILYIIVYVTNKNLESGILYLSRIYVVRTCESHDEEGLRE